MKRIISILTAVVLLSAALAACGIFGSSDSELKLDRSELEMIVGDTVLLDAGDAAKLKWESDNENVAVVHAGSVSAKSAGSANITVTADDGKSQVCAVTVYDKLVTSVSIGSSSVRLGLGKTIQLSASYTPADATNAALTWSSEDENVALVNEEGFVTGQSAGSTTIVCSAGNGVTDSCNVTVEEAPESPSTLANPETQAATQAASVPTESSASYSDDFLFPDSSTRMLSDSEVSATFASISGVPAAGSFSQDAVNEIFARHGYIFTTPSLKAYYESKSWYTPNPNFSMGDLNETERYNIEIFNKY